MPARRRVEAVLFDRDATLVVDVPYNGAPDAVVPVPGAIDALARARQHGLRLGIITNQSGVAHGLLRPADVERVNQRVVELLGPFEVVRYCPHGPGDGCRCRKPRPGMVLDAARTLGVPPARCVVIGDTGADVCAGLTAGAGAILVPTSTTRAQEVRQAPLRASTLSGALDLILGAR